LLAKLLQTLRARPAELLSDTCVLVDPGERIMKLAEELYQAGFISYPRTETDVYDPGMDLRVRTRLHWLNLTWLDHLTPACPCRRDLPPCQLHSDSQL
jgi:hypothetical protein